MDVIEVCDRKSFRGRAGNEGAGKADEWGLERTRGEKMETVSAYNSFEELCCKGKEKRRATAVGKSGVKT